MACHMCSVQSSGLFHKVSHAVFVLPLANQGTVIAMVQAIIESDAMGLPLKKKPDALDLGRKFAKQIGCGDDDIACMKEKVPPYCIS